jgi:mono/diheme cytochrome c family protein
MSGGVLPDLRYSSTETFDRYKEIVIDGERKDNGMASFADLLSEDDVKAIRAYVLEQAHIAYDAQQKAAATPATPPVPK